MNSFWNSGFSWLLHETDACPPLKFPNKIRRRLLDKPDDWERELDRAGSPSWAVSVRTSLSRNELKIYGRARNETGCEGDMRQRI